MSGELEEHKQFRYNNSYNGVYLLNFRLVRIKNWLKFLVPQLGLAVVLVVGSANIALAADTVPPGLPGDFQAEVTGDSSLVTLTWTASEDASGIREYQIDRSLDKTAWTTLPELITDVRFSDDSAAFGIHYFYRIRALDNAGNASAYVFTDATTPEFRGNINADGSSTYTSDDKIATVILPKGSVSSDAACRILKDNSFGEGSKGRPVIAGPYKLLCRSIDGEYIIVFSKPISWSYDVGKLEGLEKVGVYTFATGPLLALSSFRLNTQNGTLTFESNDTTPVVALAYVKGGISANVVVVIIAVILAIIGVVIMILHKRQKNKYDEYLRSKYYDV